MESKVLFVALCLDDESQASLSRVARFEVSHPNRIVLAFNPGMDVEGEYSGRSRLGEWFEIPFDRMAVGNGIEAVSIIMPEGLTCYEEVPHVVVSHRVEITEVYSFYLFDPDLAYIVSSRPFKGSCRARLGFVMADGTTRFHNPTE